VRNTFFTSLESALTCSVCFLRAGDITRRRPQLQLKAPGFTTRLGEKNKTLYLRGPPAIERATRKNLDLSLAGTLPISFLAPYLSDGQCPSSPPPLNPPGFYIPLPATHLRAVTECCLVVL